MDPGIQQVLSAIPESTLSQLSLDEDIVEAREIQTPPPSKTIPPEPSITDQDRPVRKESTHTVKQDPQPPLPLVDTPPS